MRFKVLSVYSFLLFLIVFSSCLERRFIKGYSEMVNIQDSLLNDSSIITGFVYEYYEDNSILQVIEGAEIQIESINLIAASSKTGAYSLKVAPDSYDIVCKRKNEEWPQLNERFDGLELGENKIVRIDFYLGYTLE